MPNIVIAHHKSKKCISARTVIASALIVSGLTITGNEIFGRIIQEVSQVVTSPMPSATQPSIAQSMPALTITTAAYKPYPKTGADLGTFDLPTLGLTWPIIQGTEHPQLAKGVGHYLKSVLPGQSDNSVLAGHRETVFNRLGELKLGDKILVTTDAGRFTYRVRTFRVVDRTDRTVIMPTDTPVLTLVTCYPFDAPGKTDQSFVVTADLISSTIS